MLSKLHSELKLNQRHQSPVRHMSRPRVKINYLSSTEGHSRAEDSYITWRKCLSIFLYCTIIAANSSLRYQ